MSCPPHCGRWCSSLFCQCRADGGTQTHDTQVTNNRNTSNIWTFGLHIQVKRSSFNRTPNIGCDIGGGGGVLVSTTGCSFLRPGANMFPLRSVVYFSIFIIFLIGDHSYFAQARRHHLVLEVSLFCCVASPHCNEMFWKFPNF